MHDKREVRELRKELSGVMSQFQVADYRFNEQALLPMERRFSFFNAYPAGATFNGLRLDTEFYIENAGTFYLSRARFDREGYLGLCQPSSAPEVEQAVRAEEKRLENAYSDEAARWGIFTWRSVKKERQERLREDLAKAPAAVRAAFALQHLVAVATLQKEADALEAAWQRPYLVLHKGVGLHRDPAGRLNYTHFIVAGEEGPTARLVAIAAAERSPAVFRQLFDPEDVEHVYRWLCGRSTQPPEPFALANAMKIIG